MITPKFLQGCTNAQVNKGVVWMQFRGAVKSRESLQDYIGLSCIAKKPKWPKYCTSPGDAWPIILENKIAIDPLNTGVKWIALEASWSRTGIEAENKNPLRAAMEVYLIMSNDK